MTDRSAKVVARELKREYAPERGVCGMELEVVSGETFALLGRNGSGKSTLTRLLLGMERPDSGSLTVLGNDLTRRSESSRREMLASIGVALDSSIHWPKLTGRDNAWFVASSYGMGADEIGPRLEELFDQADIASHIDDPVANYSFGMRRKLSIVEALCHEPELLVLDEPTAGVDAHFAARLTGILADRAGRGLTNWVASNDPDWVAKTATRVAFVDAGRILAVGSVDELLAEVAPYQEIRVVLEDEERFASPTNPRVQSFDQEGARLTFLTGQEPRLVPEIMEWVVENGGIIRSVEVHRSTLRDAFILKTGRDLEA